MCFEFTVWALSWVRKVFTLAICTFQVLMKCLAIMVILTMAFTCQFTTTGILSMFKYVTLEASQEVRNIWHRYIQVSSFDRLNESRHVKSKDQNVGWNKFVIPTNLYPPDGNNTLWGEIFTNLLRHSFQISQIYHTLWWIEIDMLWNLNWHVTQTLWFEKVSRMILSGTFNQKRTIP